MHPTLASAPGSPFPTWLRACRWLAMALVLSWAGGCASLPANTNRTPSKAFAEGRTRATKAVPVS